MKLQTYCRLCPCAFLLLSICQCKPFLPDTRSNPLNGSRARRAAALLTTSSRGRHRTAVGPRIETRHLSRFDSKSDDLRGNVLTNSATTGELRFPCPCVFVRQTSRATNRHFSKVFSHILEAQYPIGGWPQYYPLSKKLSSPHHIQ